MVLESDLDCVDASLSKQISGLRSNRAKQISAFADRPKSQGVVWSRGVGAPVFSCQNLQGKEFKGMGCPPALAQPEVCNGESKSLLSLRHVFSYYERGSKSCQSKTLFNVFNPVWLDFRNRLGCALGWVAPRPWQPCQLCSVRHLHHNTHDAELEHADS